MADANILLRGLLSRAYKLDDNQIDSLLDESTTDETGLATLIERDTIRVSEISKPKEGQTFQDGYKKAKSEVLSEFEKNLASKYGVSSTDLRGIELVEKIISDASNGGKAGITEDQVRRHPLYAGLESKLQTEVQKVAQEWQQKFEEQEKSFKRNQTFSKAKEKALSTLMGLSPILPANENIANNLKKTFLDSVLNGYDLDEREDGRFLVVKEGAVQTDPHGNNLFLDDLIKNNASNFFEFKANNGGGNAGNSNPQNGGGGQAITAPKTLEELTTVMSNTSIPVETRLKIQEEFEATNKI